MEDKPFEPHTRPPAPGAERVAEADAATVTGVPRPRLPHESLDAWRVAREVVAWVAQHQSRFRGLPGELAHHIDRSAVSVAMNIAEAAGRISPKDRKARFAIARGEACEVAAALDIATLFGALQPADLAEIRSLLVRLAQMLSRLAA